MSDNETKLLTLEGKSGIHTEADAEVWNSALTGKGLIELKPGDLEKLVQAAKETSDYFQETAAKIMTQEKATYIKKLRCDEGYSWRAVAETCHEEWEGDWGPPSNQIMGMALCEIASGFFGENFMEAPWN